MVGCLDTVGLILKWSHDFLAVRTEANVIKFKRKDFYLKIKLTNSFVFYLLDFIL